MRGSAEYFRELAMSHESSTPKVTPSSEVVEGLDALRQRHAAMSEAKNAYDRARADVLKGLEEFDPDLTASLTSLWNKREAASEWLCKKHGEQSSPIEMILEGRTDEVLSVIRRSEYGFGG